MYSWAVLILTWAVLVILKIYGPFWFMGRFGRFPTKQHCIEKLFNTVPDHKPKPDLWVRQAASSRPLDHAAIDGHMC